ncbi:hypothetical protein ACIXNI_14200 [Bacteroides fragilis]
MAGAIAAPSQHLFPVAVGVYRLSPSADHPVALHTDLRIRIVDQRQYAYPRFQIALCAQSGFEEIFDQGFGDQDISFFRIVSVDAFIVFHFTGYRVYRSFPNGVTKLSTDSR